MTEHQISDIASLGPVLRDVAKKANLSITALVGNNGSLIGVATGTRAPQDASIGPLLRILNRVDWEVLLRPLSGHGTIVYRPGSLPLMIVGADGGPLEIPVGTLNDLSQGIATMAAATDQTVSRMVKAAGTNSTSLITFATGTARGKDVRLLPLLRVMDRAEFGMYVRPKYRTRRDARLRLEAGRLLAAR